MTTPPTEPPPPPLPRPFHVMVKPAGPACNLQCRYCFYLEKDRLYPQTPAAGFRMGPEVLESFIRQYVQQDIPEGGEIPFAWQGGEPTLLGVEFFQRVVELQRQYCPPGRRISNAFQTNGILLDDAWCEFFRENNFLVGLSLDGPADLHDRYRTNKAGRGTHAQVLRALQLLQKHHVEYNALVVVTRESAQRPLDVYGFLKAQGVQFIQFIPLVERAGPEIQDGCHASETPAGAKSPAGVSEACLAPPPLLKVLTPFAPVTPWSVDPLDYGKFLCAIFDHWVRHDVGQIFVQLFDVQLGIFLGQPASLCVFAPTCGRGLALEHNGDLYACDHYVYPAHRRGNILQTPLADMVDSDDQTHFGQDKLQTLPRYCRECPVLPHCCGECPKHRFNLTPEGEPGLNYLCTGYRTFFAHIQEPLRIMAELLGHRRPAAEIMGILAERNRATPSAKAPPIQPARRIPGRNDPCPCGSGRKFKHCCGR